MANLNPEQASALRLIVSAVLETIEEAGPMGAPGGHLYAALMHAGCTYSQFVSLMGALVRSGRVVKRGECYHATAKVQA
jgi:hypothetical protein